MQVKPIPLSLHAFHSPKIALLVPGLIHVFTLLAARTCASGLEEDLGTGSREEPGLPARAASRHGPPRARQRGCHALHLCSPVRCPLSSFCLLSALRTGTGTRTHSFTLSFHRFTQFFSKQQVCRFPSVSATTDFIYVDLFEGVH